VRLSSREGGERARGYLTIIHSLFIAAAGGEPSARVQNGVQTVCGFRGLKFQAALSSKVIDVFRYYGADWVGMIFGLISTYYLAKERKRGFLFGVIGGIGWITFGVLTQSVAGVLANATFILLNFRGFVRWKRKRENEEKACGRNPFTQGKGPAPAEAH